MKDKISRAELHLEFIRSIDKDLSRSTVFDKTNHEPVDHELLRIRKCGIQIGDIIKYGKQKGKVTEVVGNILTAIDLNTHENFSALTYYVERL